MLQNASARIGVYPQSPDGERRFGVELTDASADGTAVSIALVGELDATSAEQAMTVLRGVLGGAADVDLDLAGLTWLDSAGMTVLVDLGNRVRERGGHLEAHGAHGIVRTALEIARLDLSA